MNLSDLEALEKMLAKATPGPWRHEPDTTGSHWVLPPSDLRPEHGAVALGYNGGNDEADARAIAALHNAAPELIAAARLVLLQQQEGREHEARLNNQCQTCHGAGDYHDPLAGARLQCCGCWGTGKAVKK